MLPRRLSLCMELLGLLAVAASPAAAAAETAAPFPVYPTDACAANPWIIPFEQGQAELGDFAAMRIDSLVQAWRTDGGPLLASGRVDGVEDGREPDLAGRRLAAVLQALSARGVPPDMVWARDDGGRRGFVPNQPGVPEAQNRIVLVLLARGGEQCARTMAKAQTDWVRRNCSRSHPKAAAAACDDALSRLELE